MKILASVLLITATLTVVAQHSNVQKQIDSYLEEGEILRKKRNNEEARGKINQAIALSNSASQYRLGELLTTMGDLFVDESQFDSAYQYYLKAIPLLKTDNPKLGHAWFGKGYVEYFKSQYEKSLASAIEAERISRALNDKPMLARTVKFIGSLAETEKDYKSSLKYFNEALAISESINDTLNIIRTLNSMASPYQMSGDFKKCEELLFRAVELAKKINCLKCLAISYSQLGITDFYRGKFERSIRYYQMEQAVNRKMGSTYDLFYANQNIAESLVELNRYQEALMYNDSAFQLGKNHQINQFIHDASRVRYDIYKKLNNPAEALRAFEMQMQYKDLLFTAEKAEITETLKASFDTERKERQIKELEQANTIKDLEATTARQWQYGLIIILGLLSVVAVVLYNRYQFKQRSAKVLDEKNTELQKLNGFKDRMFAVISHDLRNPVDAFSVIIESLSQNLQNASREELKEFLDTTLDSARDLKSLLNNLLEWSLIQIGKLPFNPKAESIQAITHESIRHAEAMAAAKNITIHDATKPFDVMVDKSMAIIVLRNFLTNAIKFSEQGKTIRVESEIENEHVILSVTDEGMGMKPDEVAMLFKQEANMKNIGTSSAKGAGIGLLLCKELAEKNNGKVYAKSAEGKGSTFYLALPKA